MKLPPLVKYALHETRVCTHHFKTHLRRAAKHPENPEAIHDLRVSIRRLTQCLRTFRGLLDSRRVKKLRRHLHVLMEHCGAVRNCDVAVELLKGCGLAEGVSAAKLKKTREDAARKLQRYLKKECRRHHRSISAAAHPSVGGWQIDKTLADNLRLLLPALAEDFFRTGGAAVASSSHHTLHRFRLHAKRFRYTLERFERCYGSQMAIGAKALKGVQDRLGAINDCVTTIDLLERDRRATAALQKLLGGRTSDFKGYWRSRFPIQRLAWWRGWLSRPHPKPGDVS